MLRKEDLPKGSMATIFFVSAHCGKGLSNQRSVNFVFGCIKKYTPNVDSGLGIGEVGFVVDIKILTGHS